MSKLREILLRASFPKDMPGFLFPEEAIQAIKKLFMEAVPKESGYYYDDNDSRGDGWNACREQILKNMEEL